MQKAKNQEFCYPKSTKNRKPRGRRKPNRKKWEMMREDDKEGQNPGKDAKGRQRKGKDFTLLADKENAGGRLPSTHDARQTVRTRPTPAGDQTGRRNPGRTGQKQVVNRAIQNSLIRN